jgi:hypothetical protein
MRSGALSFALDSMEPAWCGIPEIMVRTVEIKEKAGRESPQGLSPQALCGFGGAAKAVPFQKLIHATRFKWKPVLDSPQGR